MGDGTIANDSTEKCDFEGNAQQDLSGLFPKVHLWYQKIPIISNQENIDGI